MSETRFWVGIDWADQSHTVCCIDDQGKVCWTAQVTHNQPEVKQLVERLCQIKDSVSIAIETTHGLLVNELISAGLTIYAINPKQAKAWSKDLSVNAPKSDSSDAYTLAEGLRLFHQRLKVLEAGDPLTKELRLLCQDEVTLIQERTALLNRWQATLKAYYPLVLEWFSDPCCQTAWDLVLEFPTPRLAQAAPRGKLTGFLKRHQIGLSPLWLGRIDQLRKSASWWADPATEGAKSLLASSLAKQLRTLEANLKTYRTRIEALFARLPDEDIFRSLPGAGGDKIGPRLAAALGQDRGRFPTPKALLCQAGVVPLTQASGKHRVVKIRWGCDKFLRNTVYQWAFVSLARCDRARAFYDAARQSGQNHATALRNLGRKWLKILWRRWQDRCCYDEMKYLHSLKEHRSPLIKLIQPPVALAISGG
jgi:transposase